MGAQVLVDWACAKISEAGPLPDDQLRAALRKKLQTAGPSVRWPFQPPGRTLSSAQWASRSSVLMAQCPQNRDAAAWQVVREVCCI